MGNVYIYSEDSQLASELVGFAKQSGCNTTAVAFSDDEVAALQDCGAHKLLKANGDNAIVENNAAGIAQQFAQDNGALFIVGATSKGRDLAAKIAAHLNAGMASDATDLKIEGETLIAKRSVFGGSAVETLSITLPAVVTVGPGLFEPAQGAPEAIAEAAIEHDDRVTLVKEEPIEKNGTDITKASKIVAVGMGLSDENDFESCKQLASAMEAEMGCSRGIAEERHWLPVENYIGLSGKSVSPDLYLSVGISGQVQHVAGIRGAKVIVGIDANPDAPIFKACDYGIVGDLHEIVPALTNAFQAL